MNRIVINVHFQSETSPLVIDQPTVSIQDGHWVEWQFSGEIPQDCVAFIRFHNWPAPGPFQRLRFFSKTSVLAYGNVGPRESGNTYSYEALLLSPTGSHGSATGTVVNQAVEDTSPFAVVTIEQNPSATSVSDQFNVTVEPHNLFLTEGDTATWRVEGLLSTHFISMHFGGTFHHFDPLGGPFESYAVSHAEGLTQLFAYNFNFNLQPENKLPVGGNVAYFVNVRDQNGTVVGSDDPMIDNLGPPVPPPTPEV